MLTNLPKDPVLLLGVINTKLRDFYSDLDSLCEDMQIEKEELARTLDSIDYLYDETKNQFV